MKIKTALLSLALIAVALGVGLILVETKSKPSAPHIASSAEKMLDGIPRPTDKDHSPAHKGGRQLEA